MLHRLDRKAFDFEDDGGQVVSKHMIYRRSNQLNKSLKIQYQNFTDRKFHVFEFKTIVLVKTLIFVENSASLVLEISGF